MRERCEQIIRHRRSVLQAWCPDWTTYNRKRQLLWTSRRNARVTESGPVSISPLPLMANQKPESPNRKRDGAAAFP